MGRKRTIPTFDSLEVADNIWDDEHTCIVGYIVTKYAFKEHISPFERDEKLGNGALYEVYEDRVGHPHRIGWTDQPPAKNFARTNPNNTAAALTFADIVGNVGLSRFGGQTISDGRQHAIQEKIIVWGTEHRSYGLTPEQQDQVRARLSKSDSPRQAAVRLGLTKEYVEGYAHAVKHPRAVRA